MGPMPFRNNTGNVNNVLDDFHNRHLNSEIRQTTTIPFYFTLRPIWKGFLCHSWDTTGFPLITSVAIQGTNGSKLLLIRRTKLQYDSNDFLE